MGDAGRSFTTTILEWSNGRVYIELPFDPSEAWGTKERHHVSGTVDGCRVRGPVTFEDGAWRLPIGPAWLRDNRIRPGEEVSVELAAEGPQLESLPADIAAVLDAEPEARVFFESLATFYRKGYLKWLEGAARRPAVREERLREFISLLKAGKKTREV